MKDRDKSELKKKSVKKTIPLPSLHGILMNWEDQTR